ncbi:MAG TPA: SDR family NAD(P)-dependent oxidoreductase [Bacteroidota bacterium]|nr:SDR family NAD(P)-dependent oxidoreductase [Bacteroidota bacterium]
MMNIENKIALITGASAGIGEACAYKFAEAGCRLILLARRFEKLEGVSRKIRNEYKVPVLVYECDITEFNEVQDILTKLPEEWQNIDILINNAGKARGMEKIQEGSIEDWNEMIDTNIKGLLYVSRIIIPKMVTNKSGHIINIGSIAALEPYPGGNVYCGTKAFVEMISKSMVIDLNGTGVRVTNINPGMVETEFSIVRFHGDEEKAENVYKGFKPLRGEDIADIALFAVTRPAHVCIQEILVTPTAQATTTLTAKKI